MDNLEKRFTLGPVEIRTEQDNSPVLSGYALRYQSPSVDMGGWTEQLDPECFIRSLQENPDILAFYNHNYDLLLGRTTSGTLRIANDKDGIRFELDIPKHADYLTEMVQRGDLSGCSFGMIVEEDEWSDEGDAKVRTIRQAKLMEISPTSSPAYPETSVGLRSLSKWQSKKTPRLNISELILRIER